MGVVRKVEERIAEGATRLLRRDEALAPPTRTLSRLALWFLILVFLSLALHFIPGFVGFFFTAFGALVSAALAVVSLLLLWRLIADRFLWKVRNRLIISYLLLGLSPVVLFGGLTAAASYVFLGQFATVAASSEIERAVGQIANQNDEFARFLAHTPANVAPELPMRNAEFTATRMQVLAFRDGKMLPLKKSSAGAVQTISPLPQVLPKWAKPHWRGVALDGSKLSLRAIDTEVVDGVSTTVISSLALAPADLDGYAKGLGRIAILPDVEDQLSSEATDAELDRFDTKIEDLTRVRGRKEHAVVGGSLPHRSNLLDIPVNFVAPMESIDWATGEHHWSYVDVTSRPTLLYRRLFSTSLHIAVIVQDALIAVTILFALLELLACIMALRLNKTITESVSHLYTGTRAVDAGKLEHRIPVSRTDQLAELSRSFNSMASSLERLVEEQREKERLQGELEIAQEVQANLFPRSRADLPTLEVYGICQPARTVSGDYYDFLVAGRNELSIALGDISGKGISAALLMASLHSAVRAYRFAGADLHALTPQENVTKQPLSVSLASPGQVLGLLNRHLYRSTQPEKYATLFLAHYEGDTGTITYSNGGQLPPLLLHPSGSVTRLDCGGTVVGLMDHMRYEQGKEVMQVGDILIAYSDGVTEPENDFGEFGEERMLAIVHRHRQESLEAIATEVLRALRDWIGDAEQPDDITLVLARQRQG